MPKIVRTGVAAILAGLCMSAYAVADSPQAVDIPAGDLRQALLKVSEQFGTDLVYSPEQVDGIKTRGAHGELTTQQAVTKLLEGTNLEVRTDPSGAILIAPAGASSNGGQPAQPQARVELEEIVVTGTHVRNGEVVSPVTTFTRADLDRSGATSIEQFMAMLPQNFGGGQSSDSTGKLLGLDLNLSYGTAVNLRGVGSSATLVLVDGRRLAAGGGAGEFTDISLIPMSAVERIEVLTDGASATYGADAVGGVVNFIMRKDFAGAETKALYGDSTGGGGQQTEFSQLLGTQWGSGNVMLAYEHQKSQELSTLDRAFSRDATGPRDGPYNLIPGKKLDSVFTYGRQRLTDQVSVFANGLYSQRDLDILDWDFPRLMTSLRRGSTKEYAGGLGLSADLSPAWQLQVDNGWSRNDTESVLFRNAGALVNEQDARFDAWTAEARISGEAFALPAGAVKVAIGTGYRKEEYEFHSGASRAINDSDTKSAFAEVLVPLWGAAASGSRAILSLAGRYEEYSSFGRTFNPKVGVRWTALQDLAFHGTYGTSFKAPTLLQLSPYNAQNVLINLVDQSTGVTVRSIGRAGNNADLSEETAKTYTAGLDLGPSLAAGFHARLDYFLIDYDDRIGTITANPNAQLNQAAYQDSVIRRGEVPDAEFNALVTELLSGANGRIVSCSRPLDPATGACSEPVANINAIVDKRLINMASVRVSGIDLSLEREFELGSVRLDTSLNAAYLIKFDQQLTSGSVTTEQINTLYNPVDFRARAIVSLSKGSWSGTLAVNYADRYSNEGALSPQTGLPLPAASIDAWTTLDLNVQYRNKDAAPNWLQGVGVSLSVTNAFNRNPPFVNDAYLGFGYDPANADPLGRFVSIGISKEW